MLCRTWTPTSMPMGRRSPSKPVLWISVLVVAKTIHFFKEGRMMDGWTKSIDLPQVSPFCQPWSYNIGGDKSLLNIFFQAIVHRKLFHTKLLEITLTLQFDVVPFWIWGVDCLNRMQCVQRSLEIFLIMIAGCQGQGGCQPHLKYHTSHPNPNSPPTFVNPLIFSPAHPKLTNLQISCLPCFIQKPIQPTG